MQIEVKIVADENDVESLARVMHALSGSGLRPNVVATGTVSAVVDEEKTAEPKRQKRKTDPQPEPGVEPEAASDTSEESEPEEKDFTLEDLRAEMAKLAKGGKRDNGLALLEKYGASALSKVKKEDYPALMRDIEKVKAS